MIKLYLSIFLIMHLSLIANNTKLEYDIKYSDNNLIFINISKSKYPHIKKKYHIVQHGEDLEDISDDNKIELETLEKINNISRFDDLKVGSLIYLVPNYRGDGNEKKNSN